MQFISDELCEELCCNHRKRLSKTKERAAGKAVEKEEAEEAEKAVGKVAAITVHQT